MYTTLTFMFRQLQACKVKAERVKHCIDAQSPACKVQNLLRIKHVLKPYWTIFYNVNLTSEVHFPAF